MALLSRTAMRCCMQQSVLALNSKSTIALRSSSTSWDKAGEYLKEQKAKNRPLSPHLSIYKPQLTSMLSITHRMTGAGLGCGVYAIGLAALVMPGTFPHCIEAIQAMHISQAIIIPLKFGIATSFFYHYFNGMRHLMWDMGIGFKIPEVYKTGVIVMGLALVCGTIATFM